MRLWRKVRKISHQRGCIQALPTQPDPASPTLPLPLRPLPAVPDYFNSYTTQNGHGPVNTGSTSFNNVMNSIFETPAAVALMACLLLDLTIPSAPGERTREAWQEQRCGAWPAAGWNHAFVLAGWERLHCRGAAACVIFVHCV